MDTSDPSISFDTNGLCVYCNNFNRSIKPNWNSESGDQAKLDAIAEQIRQDGIGKEFDCIIGLSGGLDSSYVAYVSKVKMGLRPLLYHVDAGWNTNQAVSNIEALVDGLGLDLFTEVVNWDVIKRMQVAFLKSGIPDQDLVQDAIFFSSLYKFARKYNIKHIITGSNFSTECCREPEEWGGYLGIDKTLFKDICGKYESEQLIDVFPIVDILIYKIWYQYLLGTKVHHPLNYVRFIKTEAENELEIMYGWRRFQHKHHESRFTRFFEDFWLPQRFGYDKRRAHFSSLIMTGQMSRECALNRIKHQEMSDHFLAQEFNFVAHKLGLKSDQLHQLLNIPIKTFADYRNKKRLIGVSAKLMRIFGLEKRYFR